MFKSLIKLLMISILFVAFCSAVSFGFTVETPANNSTNSTQLNDPDHKFDDKLKSRFGTSSSTESQSGFHVYGSASGQSDNPANNDFTPRPAQWGRPTSNTGR